MSPGGRNAVYDKSLGTVHIWTKDGRTPAQLVDLINGRVNRVTHQSTDGVGAPHIDTWGIDFHLYVTTSGITSNIERAAGRAGCGMPIALPRAAEWLRDRIAARVQDGHDVNVLVRGGAW